MKNKEEQIQEMVNVVSNKDYCYIVGSCAKFNYGCSYCKSNALYNAGYRKASDVVSEFVKKLIDFPHWLENGTVLVIHMEELLDFAAEFGVEVEK